MSLRFFFAAVYKLHQCVTSQTPTLRANTYVRVRSDFLRHPYAILHISTICPISHASINFAKFCTKNEDIAKINFSESASLRFFCLPLRQKPLLSHSADSLSGLEDCCLLSGHELQILSVKQHCQNNKICYKNKKQNGGELDLKVNILVFCADFGKINTRI